MILARRRHAPIYINSEADFAVVAEPFARWIFAINTDAFSVKPKEADLAFDHRQIAPAPTADTRGQLFSAGVSGVTRHTADGRNAPTSQEAHVVEELGGNNSGTLRWRRLWIGICMW